MSVYYGEAKIEEIQNGYLVYSAYPNIAYNDKPKYFETIDEVSEFLKEKVFN
ncbi:MAG: hypothetical protein ACOCRO_00525 [Halanaerobiales bacterium]